MAEADPAQFSGERIVADVLVEGDIEAKVRLQKFKRIGIRRPMTFFRRQCLHRQWAAERSTQAQVLWRLRGSRVNAFDASGDRATSVQMDEDEVCRGRLRGEQVLLADGRNEFSLSWITD